MHVSPDPDVLADDRLDAPDIEVRDDPGLHDLIDDRARHFAHFRGQGLLFSAPHNMAESRYERVNSWCEVREVFSRIAAAGPVPRRPPGRPGARRG